MKDGDCVIYRPSLNGPERFSGVINGEPWPLGGRTVVRLREMEPAYGIWRGDPSRTTVSAVDLIHLTPSPAGKPGTQEEA